MAFYVLELCRVCIADTVLIMQAGWIQRKSATLQHEAQICESLLLAEEGSDLKLRFTLRSGLCQGLQLMVAEDHNAALKHCLLLQVCHSVALDGYEPFRGWA